MSAGPKGVEERGDPVGRRITRRRGRGWDGGEAEGGGAAEGE